MEAVMSSDSGELPAAARSDDELPRATENPEVEALDPAQPQEMGQPLHDHYTTADIRTLLHRLYALASQI
jgi:hypothetical protein